MKEDKSKRVRAALLEVVEKQINDNSPPETRETLQRLLGYGYSEADAKQMIGGVVCTEVFAVLSKNEVYSEERYINALKALPAQPENMGHSPIKGES